MVFSRGTLNLLPSLSAVPPAQVIHLNGAGGENREKGGKARNVGLSNEIITVQIVGETYQSTSMQLVPVLFHSSNEAGHST